MAADEKKDGGVSGNISVCANMTGSALASGQNFAVMVTFSGPDAAECWRLW
jgi:hypothetical protein